VSLAPGARLGAYEVLSLLGAGGMGEVYRANDPQIGRDVAIKVLSADFAVNKERVARFEQEAQAAGALNHPNILAIYDVNKQDHTLYVVSELLSGEELRDRLGHGQIPLRKAIDYAQQVVSGLSAAHEKGIVHRDLKPENLFITKDERVKILDFGIAKLTTLPQATNPDISEDATRKVLTNPGMVLGTVGYMSPEQVRGEKADYRSDIFSFGAILHEMITGRRAFKRETMAETMTAILKEEPEELSASNQTSTRRWKESSIAASKRNLSGDFNQLPISVLRSKRCQRQPIPQAADLRPRRLSQWRRLSVRFGVNEFPGPPPQSFSYHFWPHYHSQSNIFDSPPRPSQWRQAS